jgi:hypothetical protein
VMLVLVMVALILVMLPSKFCSGVYFSALSSCRNALLHLQFGSNSKEILADGSKSN